MCVELYSAKSFNITYILINKIKIYDIYNNLQIIFQTVHLIFVLYSLE